MSAMERKLKRYLMHRPSRAATNDFRSVATPETDLMAVSFEQITSEMYESTIMLSCSSQGEISVLRVRLRVVKKHYKYTLAH